MLQNLPIHRRRHASARRLLAAPALGLLTAAALLLAPAVASADTSSTLSIVGTSDVSDSGLIPNLIQPAFQKAFPQFTFKYTGSATGTAIQSAENGTGGPSALIVHAASLENQFVAGGYSLNNQYGNAIFTNDFVLAGPTADASHANVTSNAANNIAQAFADVAAAGVQGTATFFTRGGAATAPGTTVAEHGIWALVGSAGLTPTGVSLCTVSAADGGGMSPINPASPAAGGNCPDSGTVDGTGGDLPSWYHIQTGNQAANVIATNACTAPGSASGANSCYALTDRGTYDYLGSGTDPAGSIPNLKIVTRQNSASAPGGANELINYFHVYIINPSKPGETVNTTAAQDFVNFITSPALQSQLKGYLANTGDPEGPPFVADASPTIASSPSATTIAGGKPVTISGTVTNNEPGYAVPSGQPVTVSELFGTLPVKVATGNTDSAGHYAVTFTPSSSGSYQVSTGSISQVEIASLNPVYGDILSPAASSAIPLTVQGGVTIVKTIASSGGATVTGVVNPVPIDGNGTVTVSTRPKTSTGAFTQLGKEKLAAGETTYAVSGNLKPGTYTVRSAYADGPAFAGATSSVSTVTIRATTAFSPSFNQLSIKNGKLTLTGTLNSAASASGATVKLFGLKTVKLPAKQTQKIDRVAHTAAAGFEQIGKTTVKSGSKSFTIKVKLTRGYRWILQLQFVQKGQASTYSKVRDLDVH